MFRIIFFASVFFAAHAVGALEAATLYVGPDETHTTIQSAIDAASNGDTVTVRDGTYTGDGNRNLNFAGKALHLKSENGPENCIIDVQGSSGAIRFQSGEGNETIVEGFTITRGYEGIGGAISISNSSPIITGNIFSGNTASQSGGAIYVSGSVSEPRISTGDADQLKIAPPPRGS